MQVNPQSFSFVRWAQVMTPQSLYKFHPDNKYLIEMLVDKSLFCCDRKKLNDPHDGLFLISDELKRRMLNNAAAHVVEGFSNNPLYNTIPKSFIADFADKSFCQKSFYELLESKGGTLKVCSLTENRENELMWAHYAENSKGACLEFDFSYVPNIQNCLVQVQYTNEVPIAEELTLSELKRLFSIKRKAWEKEEEWRILVNDIDKVSFEPKNLRRILFGARMDLLTREKIIETCKKNNLEHVDFKTMNITLNGINFI